MELNKIYNKDCIQGLSEMKDNFVDITVTSPPYNLGSKIFRRRDINSVGYEDNMDEEKYFLFLKEVIKQLIRVTKNYVFFNIQPTSSNKRTVYRLIGEFSDCLKEVLIWHKKRSPPCINSNVLNHNYEFILVFDKNNPNTRSYLFDFGHKGELKTCWFGEINDLFYKESFNVDGHCAIFPIWLPRKIIHNFSKEDEIVLDPFSGCGSVALCCQQMNRKYIGFEIIPEFIDITNKRLNQKSVSDFWSNDTHNRNLTEDFAKSSQINPKD